MTKRIVSIVLLLTMLMSFMVPSVSAAEDDIYIENAQITNGEIPDEISDIVQEDTPETTEAAEETTAPSVEEVVTTEVEDEPVSLVPSCDCGNEGADISVHSDGCAAKQYYKTLCAGSAGDIYALWSQLPQDGQAFVKQYLSWTNTNTLKELEFLISANWENEDGLNGVATTTKDGSMIGAFGVPENAQLQVNNATAEAQAAVDAFLATQDDDATTLFTWDISVIDSTRSSWQPDGSVQVVLEVPGEKLHKYTRVYVVHVDDQGNAEKIAATVTEDGKIAFYTNGFSTFAGYTVDFEYDGVPFSIPGETSILLSELMDQLKMPFDVEEVANVVFSTPELLSVTKEGSDWRLTSLLPFQTNETLTLEMTDGKVYVIEVTDASYPSVKINGTTTATNGTITWYADGDGNLKNGWTEGHYSSYAKYWSQEFTIFVSGSGTLTINIEPASYANVTDTDYKVNIAQINVSGGAKVRIVMSEAFTKNLIIQNMDNRTMFKVENGSLVINGANGNSKLILDGKGSAASQATQNPIVYLGENAISLKVLDSIFRNGKDGGIQCRSNDLDTFEVERCTFEKSIKRDGNGGAIYIFSNTADSKGSYVDIHDFKISNSAFNNNNATGSGGAIEIQGYIHKGDISNCTFTGCTSVNHGGAIDLAGNLGAFTVQNNTFTSCTAGSRGGGVAVRSIDIKNGSDYERWTRSHAITFSGCTFSSCEAGTHGGGIGVLAQIRELTVTDSDFKDCAAGANGGGISIDGRDLPDNFGNSVNTAVPNWCAKIECTNDECAGYGSDMGSFYNWKGILDESKTVDKKSWISTVNITNGCTFTNCTADSNGGGVEFASGLYIKDSATISNATFDGCKAVGEASAIYWSFCYVKLMQLLDSVFQNCSFIEDSSYTKTIHGGTVKTVGNSTLVLDVQRCKFIGNSSPKNGAGLYWNAARGLDGLVCKATVNDCLFEKNTTVLYGGGIFTESDIVVTKCHIRYNTAYIGGGIAQQVYNNAEARMLEAGGVTELKLDPNTWIHHNTANLGGGVSVLANETSSITDGSPIPYTVRFELNGAAVYQNNAIKLADGTCGHGGGIYFAADSFPNNEAKQAEVDAYTKEILINQGTGTAAAVYGNTAEGNGGGIYMESSEDTKLRIEQGYISGNTANNGGGIYMTGKNATCYVTGGIVGGEGNDSQGVPLSNVAKEDASSNGGCGGGIAISGGARIEMEGGEISYNKVVSNGTNGNDLQGGGIWLAPRGDNGVANTMLLKGGNIKYNSTPGGSGCDGGGVFVGSNGQFTIEDGNIQNNTCGTSWGGGLYCYNATVNIDGGDISANTAGNGGGIFAHNNSAVSVTGGTIKSNAATSQGGGIYAYWGSDLTVTGGEIKQNSAGSGGGIFVMGKTNSGTPVYDTVVQIMGGMITENVASGTSSDKGLGGGIYAGNFCDVTISQSENTVGKITKNTASRGGGVSVNNGAKLTVENGFITYNNALDTNKSSTSTTTYHMHDGLYGVGGGIYVSNGYSDEDTSTTVPSTVIVKGTNIGIYGNIADFAADDVFSNGLNTSLTIPGVQNMNLTEFEFAPEGWVEDYCNADTLYLNGTESVLDQNTYSNGKENVRYRISNAYNRMIIPDEMMSTAVNVDNAYICMTLGIPAALPDTVVIDFGLPVLINMLDNDMMTRYTDKALVGIYNDKSIDTGDVSYTTSMSDLYKMDTKMNCSYGTIEVAGDNKVLYTPYTMQMTKEDVFSYSVYYGNFYYYADVNVIPATTIYYEDNFAGADGEDYITFSSYQYNVKTNVRDASTNAVWTDETCEFTCPDGDLYQDMDRIGVDTDDKLGNNDMDSNYGYDLGMTGSPAYSFGAAKKFVSSQVGDTRTVGEARFTFTGTGFDVISAASSNTGTITVQVKKHSDSSVVKNKVVDTYYGYTYSDGEWIVDTDNSDVLYQVPVLKCNNLPHDTYDVTITVSYMDFFDHKHDGSYDFYLDAIRIYDPANDGKYTDPDTNEVKYNDVIKDAYVADGEGWPEYVELRNLLIKRADFDNSNVSGVSTAGVLFIDGRGNITEGTTTPDGNGNNVVTGVSDYMNYGPNNEVYLQTGQAVAFNFTLTDASNVASVQIGLKSLNGTAKVRCYGFDDEGTVYALGTSENTYKTIATATDLYYDITDLLGKNIVIMNAGVEGDPLLSITNIKVTYETEHVDSLEKDCFISNADMASEAIHTIDNYYASLKAPAAIDLVGASLSFEDEILTNLYYTTSNMDDVAEGDMGLLTWSQMPENVIYDSAEQVYAGAAYVAESERYMVRTDGIAAKELGDDIYMAVYAKLSDGSYVYSDVLTYSPKQYAMSRLEKSDNDNLKALCVAMLNYGAAAQTYFGYKTDALMNADLTAEQQALVAAYDAKLFTGAVRADSAKIGDFAATETGFSGVSASVSFEGAFALNYYFAVTNASNVTFYYWTKDAYQNAEILTAENASGTMNMAVENGICHSQISGIAAKQLDDTYYVAAVYTVDGETYCTGVIAYSLSTYCMKHAQSNMGELAQATAVYGYHAKAYFG